MSTITATRLLPAIDKSTTISNRNFGNSEPTPTKRRLSESSADELQRNRRYEVANKNSWTINKMWRNELFINDTSSDAQPHMQREGCGREALICCSGDNKKTSHEVHRISDMIDVGIRVALVIIFIFLEMSNSFKRKIHMEEMWLYRNPRTPDIVTPATLIVSVILAPFLTTLLHLWLTGDRRDFRAASWVWTLALGLNGLATSLLKITVGRHRPDFFYRCFPDGKAVLNNLTEATLNGSVDIFNCTGNIHDINEGRKSFPSGHASFAFVSFSFIAFYVGAKLHAFSPRGRGQSWRLFITLMPEILAALIAVSRTCDYHHHWEDVLAGGLIGLSISYFVYRQYYPSIFASNCHRAFPRGPRRCYVRQNSTNKPVYVNLKSVDDAADGAYERMENEDYEEEEEFNETSKEEKQPLIVDE